VSWLIKRRSIESHLELVSHSVDMR